MLLKKYIFGLNNNELRASIDSFKSKSNNIYVDIHLEDLVFKKRRRLLRKAFFVLKRKN